MGLVFKRGLYNESSGHFVGCYFGWYIQLVGLVFRTILSHSMPNRQSWWQLIFFILMKLCLFICFYDLSKTTNTVCNNRVILKIQNAETCEMQVVFELPVW